MSGDCGCGCGGETTGSGTSIKDCGGAPCGCEPSLRGVGFIRPRFFSGMLLTEDDLQGIVDYASAKRRLTNRHVFGRGVVCGLDVTCHPCDAGSVRVSPGYAIECCGNDIFVSCEEEVDIIALVRDLRRRQGVDCGDPCEDNPQLDYYLYVRYTEQPTAPVAPYASDECVIGECEFSRVREGYCFELRCEMPDDELSSRDRVRKCRGDEAVTKEDASRLAQVVRAATTYERVVAHVKEGPEPVPDFPTKRDFEEVEQPDKLDLPRAVEVLKGSSLALAMSSAAKKGNAPWPGLNTSRLTVISNRSRALARRVLASEELQALPAPERARLEAIAGTAEQQPDLSDLNATGRAWMIEGLNAHDVEGGFITDALAMKGRVLKELSRRGQTRCEEYRRVSALRFDTLNLESKRDAMILGQAYLRRIGDCECDTVNPPCLTCTDAAVPLARVRVDGCDVTDVCALERRWVVSPRAIAYWMNTDDTFAFLARACCDEDEYEAPEQPRPQPSEPVEATEPTVWRSISPLSATREPEIEELAAAVGRAPRAARAPDPAATAIRALEAKVDVLEKRLGELTTPTKEGEQP